MAALLGLVAYIMIMRCTAYNAAGAGQTGQLLMEKLQREWNCSLNEVPLTLSENVKVPLLLC